MRADFRLRNSPLTIINTIELSVDHSKSAEDVIGQVQTHLKEHPESFVTVNNGTRDIIVVGERMTPQMRQFEFKQVVPHKMPHLSPELIASIHVPVAGSVNHKFSAQRICGRDNGKPIKRSQPRNALCCCGSGRKAKKCCVYFPQPEQGTTDAPTT